MCDFVASMLYMVLFFDMWMEELLEMMPPKILLQKRTMLLQLMNSILDMLDDMIIVKSEQFLKMIKLFLSNNFLKLIKMCW